MTQGMENIQAAEVAFPSTDLAADLAFYTRELGFRFLKTLAPFSPGAAGRCQVRLAPLPSDPGQ